MMLKIVLSLLLPLFCDAKIKLNITVAANKNHATVKYSGSDAKLITDYEVGLFNISMANLNAGVLLELGRVPDEIFFKDPTPYGDLFKKFKWPEVRRNLEINKVDVQLITKEVILKTEAHDNNSTADSVIERSLFTSVENSVYSDWSTSGLPAEDIAYEVNIKVGHNSYKYQNTWRNRASRYFSSQIGRSDKRNMTLKSGQGLVLKLKALKTSFIVRVDYKADLIGNLVLDYEQLYGKYHFYAPTVNNIMKTAKIVNEIKTSETIEIRCYTDPKLEVYDRDTGALIRLRKQLFWKNKKDDLLKFLRSPKTIGKRLKKN